MQALKRHALIEQPAWFRLYLKAPQPLLQATNRHATPKAEYCAQSHVRPSWFFAVLKTPTDRNSGMFGAHFWLKQNKLSEAPVSVAREEHRSGVKRSRRYGDALTPPLQGSTVTSFRRKPKHFALQLSTLRGRL